MTEAQALARDASEVHVAEVTRLQGEIAKETWHRDNIRDILLRQKTIRGFWIEPSAIFQRVKAEVKALEGRLLCL